MRRGLIFASCVFTGSLPRVSFFKKVEARCIAFAVVNSKHVHEVHDVPYGNPGGRYANASLVGSIMPER